jgi:hypothetical protein
MLEDDNGAVRLRAAAGYLRLSAIEAGTRAKKRSTPTRPPAPEQKK